MQCLVHVVRVPVTVESSIAGGLAGRGRDVRRVGELPGRWYWIVRPAETVVRRSRRMR